MKRPTRNRAAHRDAQRKSVKRGAAKSRPRHAAPAAETTREKGPIIAFALGGLAGNNAHGAGFLQAALDENIVPAMISCTSGQIRWVYHYLRARRNPATRDALLLELQNDIGETQPFPSRDLDLLTLGWFGKPGVMRVAWAEAALDLGFNALRGLGRIALAPAKAFVARELLDALPARQLVMKISDGDLAAIATEFNQCTDIGIVFNSYDPVHGHEHLHLNDQARELLQKPRGTKSKIRDECTTYQEINPEAVRDALWIYQYGFDDRHVIDGAYHRQIILEELVPAEKIFVARPFRLHWDKKEMPETWPEVEDLKTEMFFDGGYRCERDKIEIVNKLCRDQVFEVKKGSKYHPVDVVEVELENQRSYFDYLFEDESVFRDARRNAAEIFRAHLNLARPHARPKAALLEPPSPRGVSTRPRARRTRVRR